MCFYAPLTQKFQPNIPKIFENIRSQIRLIAKLADEYIEATGRLDKTPAAFHFRPNGYCHVITAIYPINKSLLHDNDLTSGNVKTINILFLTKIGG